MAAHTTPGSGFRLLQLEPAMGFGFGSARLLMAPAGIVGARFPARVHAVEGIAVPAAITGVRFGPELRTSSTSSRRRGLVVGALPTGGRATGFFVAPVAAGAGSLRESTIAATVAGSSSTTGRRGVVAIGAAPRDFSMEDDDDEPSEPADRSDDDDVRSKKHVAAWVELARLQTTFEVAFNADVLKSGRDLRRVLDAIGEIDLTAPSRPWSTELCHDRISNIIGAEVLKKLLGACTPEDDQFGWSALAAQSVIEGIEKLMAILVDLLHEVPDLPMSDCCRVILKQLLKVLVEFSTIIESTKFRRPQCSLRYRLLEAHALALEHTCAIALDAYEEIVQKVPEHQWTQLRRQLMNRRITLFEQDMVVMDYIVSTGLTDTESVCDVLEKVVLEAKNKKSSSAGNN